jgi:hypothetical protein
MRIAAGLDRRVGGEYRFHKMYTMFTLRNIVLCLALSSGIHAFSADAPKEPVPPTNTAVKVAAEVPKPKFTKEQVNRRLAELKELLDRGLILQDFYERKVKECEVSL